jgi:hypothetical protein
MILDTPERERVAAAAGAAAAAAAASAASASAPAPSPAAHVEDSSDLHEEKSGTSTPRRNPARGGRPAMSPSMGLGGLMQTMGTADKKKGGGGLEAIDEDDGGEVSLISACATRPLRRADRRLHLTCMQESDDDDVPLAASGTKGKPKAKEKRKGKAAAADADSEAAKKKKKKNA